MRLRKLLNYKKIAEWFIRMKLSICTTAKIKKEIMSDKIFTINKLTKELEQLLNDKQAQYGNFDNTSYALKGVLESFLSAYNGYKVKVPANIFGVFMINLKLWRTITNKNYKKDSFDDVNGYNELNRRMKLKEVENARE